MRVSFTMDFRNAPARRQPWREFWEDNLWLMCEAEAMGFDILQVQEHFFTDDGYGPSMPIFLTALAERTTRARLMAFLYILPLRNPAQLAQETAVLDHLSGGRLDVAVGIGHRLLEYKAFGIDPSTRGARMEEAMTALQLAWTTRPFSFHGEFLDFDGIEVRPEPLQDPHPPLWVGATTPRAAARAGRHGAHLAPGAADPAIIDAYWAARDAAGFDRASARIAFGLPATVTREDPDEVWERHKELYHYRWDFYRKIRAELGDPDLAPTNPGPDFYRSYETIGPPELVIENARRVVDDFGVTDLGFFGPPSGMDLRTEGYASLKLFAEEVLPIVHDW
jgi:alkanesulfonate monooxygenase SsuD/methylene tetrahydromethanopterin reductase-like flavin-dependent oxidoreductase (luciferase family)